MAKEYYPEKAVALRTPNTLHGTSFTKSKGSFWHLATFKKVPYMG